MPCQRHKHVMPHVPRVELAPCDSTPVLGMIRLLSARSADYKLLCVHRIGWSLLRERDKGKEQQVQHAARQGRGKDRGVESNRIELQLQQVQQ